MKKSLAHLPEHKRDELKLVKEILLVFTNYRPKLYDLEKLTRMVGGCDPGF